MSNELRTGNREPGTDKIIEGHRYDGIQEFDNPMPRWWTGIFLATIVFSVAYYLGMHVFSVIDTYDEDLAESMQELEAVRAAYAAVAPAFEVDDASLEVAVRDPAMAASGKVHFDAFCIACHGDLGQGSIGPNLTDAYWIHGAGNVEIFDVISKGVLDKGMPPWESALEPHERAELLAYVRSIEGTNPPGAKEPQGELVE
jgi:cytochrome c oxidase cbb3-type subunit 3